MVKALKTLLYVLLLSVSVIAAGCTTVQIKQNLKAYNIVIKPGNNLRPHSLEEGDGTVRYLETQPGQGNTLMIIVRGKL
ncbi:MAG: hypothetical protein JXX14_21245 [Deltaproteobacteria bacterium]|nr:hypothetical protein [Deltaproteobacteria bacterium]